MLIKKNNKAFKFKFAALGKCLLPAVLALFPLMASAQQGVNSASAAGAFHAAANHYIAGQQQEALQTVDRGLRQHPNDPKLKALKQKLLEQQKQKSQQEQQDQDKNQNQQSQQQQEAAGGQQSEDEQNEQGAKQQARDQQRGQGDQQDSRESDDGEGEEQEVQARDPRGEIEKRLKEMNISPEKARMMLDAMKSNEIQYLQQKQRQPARRQKSDKPDW